MKQERDRNQKYMKVSGGQLQNNAINFKDKAGKSKKISKGIFRSHVPKVDQPIAGSVVITRESSSDPVSAVLTNDYSWIYKVLQPGKKLYDGHGVARPSAFVGGSGQQFIRDLEVVMNDRGGPGLWLWKKIPRLIQGLPRPPGGAAALLRGSDSSGLRETLVEKRGREAAAKAEQHKRQAKERRLADLREEFLVESRQGAGGASVKQSKKAITAQISFRPNTNLLNTKDGSYHGISNKGPDKSIAHGLSIGSTLLAKGGTAHQSKKGEGVPKQSALADDGMSLAREQALAAYRLLRAQQNRRQNNTSAGQLR